MRPKPLQEQKAPLPTHDTVGDHLLPFRAALGLASLDEEASIMDAVEVTVVELRWRKDFETVRASLREEISAPDDPHELELGTHEDVLQPAGPPAG